MAGEAMAQHMRVQVLAQLAYTGLAHAQLHCPRADASALLTDKHRAISRIGQRTQRQPTTRQFCRFYWTRNKNCGGCAVVVEYSICGIQLPQSD